MMLNLKKSSWIVWFLLWAIFWARGIRAKEIVEPYKRQTAEQVQMLSSESAQVRAGAAEALGFLRAYDAEAVLIERLGDPSVEVRRQVAMALAWCGGRPAIGPLIEALEDRDAMTAQAAHVALTNLTGQEFVFDALGDTRERKTQVQVWRRWWATVPADRTPYEVSELLEGWTRGIRGDIVTVSSTYKGPAHVLRDGRVGPKFWQTKNVDFPQWCIVDLGRAQEISEVVVEQYGSAFVMTEYEVATSVDNKNFTVVERKQGQTPVRLVVRFSPRTARYVRVTSFGSKNPTYPTTFFEIEVHNRSQVEAQTSESIPWRCERGFRALGVLGGKDGAKLILKHLKGGLPSSPEYRPAACAAIAALGRLRDEVALPFLLGLLEDTLWARHAAEALGDLGDKRAIEPLIAAYRKYAKQFDGRDPQYVPRDDKMTFPSEDRMLETPYKIAFALCRLLGEHSGDKASLQEIVPLIMANLPGDHDTFILYKPEVGHELTQYLLELSGLRQEACEHAFVLLGQKQRVVQVGAGQDWPRFTADRMATWLPAVCTEQADVPRLLALLSHEDGWVRLNAAKTLTWLGDHRVAEPIAQMLTAAKSEAEYGYSATFKDEEYADPAPRWREGLIRALGLLQVREYADLLVKIAEDEGSVVDIRYAAVQALADMGGDVAIRALVRAAREHPFHSVRQVARDAVRQAGESWNDSEVEYERPAEVSSGMHITEDGVINALVFIKGDNSIPNTIGTVEQADRWRQTYVVTDSGPAYRPGRNLYILRRLKPDGMVTPLTRFRDGYVAEPEVSWDGQTVVFTYRAQDNPWWHIYRINIDGSGLKQLTYGPYHDVGPAFRADGRIVFSSTRSGIRDEYHGYPCTSLHVMNADGSDIHIIATNIGRDNEPAVMMDGRLVFSRLEVFYSRNKTELTLHAVAPDGTHDIVLYGPERRAFWRNLDHGLRTPADGQEAPLTHRVLRMTQPQPMPDGTHLVVVTQGGLALVGPDRNREEIITPDNKTRAYTTPFPLSDGRILCASTLKVSNREDVDLGLYVYDPSKRSLSLVYNDPCTADFEARPIMARQRPPVLSSKRREQGYSGRFLCTSVHITQEKDIATRGRFIRAIEGVPMVARHSTQTNRHEVWKNHGGTFARVLGTAPLAGDGSFFVETPADRLIHFQVLDSNRRVLGNQLTWISPRAGETRSCVGCHESPGTLAKDVRPRALRMGVLDFLPSGDEFTYRAKAWFKGSLPDEIEERTRTVRAVNLLAR